MKTYATENTLLPSSDLPLPPGPPTHPIRQLYLLLTGQAENMLPRLAEAYGPIARLSTGRPRFLVSHPDYIKHVLVDNQRNYLKQGRAPQRLIFGQSVGMLQGAAHRRERRLLQPAFHRTRIAAYGRIMRDFTQRHLANWQAGQTLDMYADMKQLVTAIVGQCLFGLDQGPATEQFYRALRELGQDLSLLDLTNVGPWFAKLPTRRGRRNQRNQRILDEVIYGLIAERRAQPEKGMMINYEGEDLLSMLLEVVDSEGDQQGLTDQQVRDDVMNIYVAGHETAALGLMWTLYLLAQHPDEEQRVQAEVDTVLQGRPPAAEDIPRLTYTYMALAESLRLYPPAPVLHGRVAVAEDVIGGYRIPAGSVLLLSPWVTQRHPAYWDEPTLFRPARFAPEAVAERPRYAYFPFGGGVRQCLGEPFAWMEMQIILASIVQRFCLRPLAEVGVRQWVGLRPAGGRLDMRLVERVMPGDHAPGRPTIV